MATFSMTAFLSCLPITAISGWLVTTSYRPGSGSSITFGGGFCINTGTSSKYSVQVFLYTMLITWLLCSKHILPALGVFLHTLHLLVDSSWIVALTFTHLTTFVNSQWYVIIIAIHSGKVDEWVNVSLTLCIHLGVIHTEEVANNCSISELRHLFAMRGFSPVSSVYATLDANLTELDLNWLQELSFTAHQVLNESS